MAKPLPTQITFSGVAPPWSLVNLDADITNLWSAVDDIGTYSNTLTDTGAVNALVANPPAGITFALASGITLIVVCGTTTTSTTPTLNVNATGAKPIVDTLANSLAVGALRAGGRYLFVYDGANWRCLNPSVAGVVLAVVKPADTNRSNTATLAIDSDLQLSLGVGTYRVECLLNFVSATSGSSPGGQASPAFSGTMNAAISVGTLIIDSTVGGDSVSTNFGVAPAPPSSAPPLNCRTAAQGATAYQVTSILVATGAGVLSIYWAQNVSGATATTLRQGSYLMATQIG